MARFKGTNFAKRAGKLGITDQEKAVKLAKNRPNSVLGKMYAKASAGGVGGDSRLATKPATRVPGGGTSISRKPAQLPMGDRNPALVGGIRDNMKRFTPEQAAALKERSIAKGGTGNLAQDIVGMVNQQPGAGGGDTDAASWAAANMPQWMKDRGTTPEQALNFIQRNPQSGLAQMYNEAGIGAPGGGASTPMRRLPDVSGGVSAALQDARARINPAQQMDMDPTAAEVADAAPANQIATRPAMVGRPEQVQSAGAYRPPRPAVRPPMVSRPGIHGGVNPGGVSPGGQPPKNIAPDRGMNTAPTGGMTSFPDLDLQQEMSFGAEMPTPDMPPGPTIAQPGVESFGGFSQVNPAAVQSILRRIMAGGGNGRPIMAAMGGQPMAY